MKKLDKKELKKMATKCMKEEIYNLPDVFFQSDLVKKAMMRCYEIGYRYGEDSNNK
jgi:hypothetical protein